MTPTLIYGFATLFSGLICAGVSAYLAPFWHRENARQLLLLMAGMTLWSIGYGMEFFTPDLPLKLFWVRIEYAGNVWIGMLVFKFIIILCGKQHWLTPRTRLLLCLIPMLILAAALFNEFHGLLWKRAWTDTIAGIQVVMYERGPLFWLFISYSYSLMLWATWLLFNTFRAARNRNQARYRSQLGLILCGIMVPWSCNILYVFGFQSLQHIDLTPFSFMTAGVVFLYGLVRYQLLNLIPLAREAILESMGDPVLVLDMNDRIVEINEACKRIFGIEGFVPGQHTAKELFPGLSGLVARFRETRTVETETVLPASDPSRHWHLGISPLRARNGAQKGWLIVLRDITDLKTGEAALRQARDYVRSIINSMPSVLIGVNEHAVVTQWNLEAEKMTGIRATQARNKPLSAVFPHMSDVIADISRAIRDQAVQKREKAPLTLNSRECTTDITIYPILSKDSPGAVIRVDDISERIKMEEMIVHSEKMMSVGGLAAGMAHEINNPLAGVLQNIQVIRNRLSKPLPANVRAAEKFGINMDILSGYMAERDIFQMIDQAVSVGMRAAKIVENMLSFSRKSDSRRSSHSLEDMMESTLDLISNDFNLKKRYDIRSVEIVRQKEADLPLVPCEKTKIQQVFFNILKNGVEAMSEAAVASPCFTIRYFMANDMAGVEIRDNGPGIPGDVRKRIFEPFFTTKEVGIGTGLGLSVSYFIVTENHGGELAVSSSPETGTAFIVKLPAT